ncbi:hypothetical protein PRUPE_2G230700 [Prunus persica]|uniref:Tify domain-containing protein n=1 Tax=Prunus persica TaxID=3760 RepID=M5XM46_PRUPE|nr:uncharacterized protein LOC18786609 [Prunus persica]ONI24229.1 hypothetical protein PRUPE_2G230700 [Prunus persica]
MSFQPKSFWIPRDASCLTDGEMGYDNSSRIESKRGNRWFMDSNGLEFFNNKKQAMEAVNGRPVSGVPHLAISPWDNTSGFQSVPGQFTDRLFGSEPVRTVNLGDRNIQSVGSENMNLGRKGFEDQYGNDPSVGLSMSHTIEDPSSCLNFGGIRKVKVNEVRDSDDVVSASMGHSYCKGDSNTMSMANTYNKSDDNAISLGSAYNTGEENAISIGPSFNKADDNFISMGHTFSKANSNFISMAHNYNKGDNSILSMGQPFDKEDGNFISMGQSYEKGDSSFISLGNSYHKGHENFISMGATYGKANENFISMAPTYDKQTDNMMSMGPNYDKADSNVVPIGPPYHKGESNVSMSHNYNKNESTTISFGSFHHETDTNPSGGIISSYDLLMNNQNTAEQSEESGLKDPIQSNMDPNVDDALKLDSKTDTVSKIKEPKTARKAPPNNFPSNVKSLLSTGMFDGVPVKYVSWSREKNLKGIIKGTGYLCSCDDCNHSKSLNAYEFERHAGAKTKHPNNHIYFENGKTIYAVVQELKNTPQEMLFDAIQTVTGSPINQKNFRIWKASYQAATRELQRIYGKDEVAIQS